MKLPLLIAAAWMLMAATESLAGASASATPAAPKAGVVFRDCADCPDMVVIAAGSFMMGSTPEEQHQHGVPKIFADQESPRHHVTLRRPYAIGRTEITRDLYARFVSDTQRPDHAAGCGVHNQANDTWTELPGYSWHHTGYEQTDAHPVVCVNWNDARDYVTWLSEKSGQRYRLPSEAEWEYAARAGTEAAAYWGETAEQLCENANVMTSATYELIGRPDSWTDRLMCSGTRSYTMPVGSYDANRFGLFDMIGNVWEWVQDCSHNTFNGAPRDGSSWHGTPCPQRVLRGGAFHSAPFFGRAAAREGGQDPAHAGNGVGIRVVRELNGSALPVVSVTPRVIVGDAVRGQQQFGPCTKCHTVEAGGADQIGPNLQGFFAKAAAINRPGYAYSAELRKSGIVWTEAALDAFIQNPAVVVPHTSMSFAGITKAATRANLIAYVKLATNLATDAAATSVAGKAFSDCSDCPEMVIIPAGSNVMGTDAEPLDDVRHVGPVDLEYIASSETPRHRVTISQPFALGRYEITRAQYARFVADTQRPDPAACVVHDSAKDTWTVPLAGYSWRNPSFPQEDSHPVVCIDWSDARDYTAWLSRKTDQRYRLPSEAEWEYAARGGTNTSRYWGESSETLCERVQIGTTATAAKLGPSRHWQRVLVCGSDSAFTRPVGSFPANPFGLYDMLGNVVEITADCFHDNLVGAPQDGSAWTEPDCHRHVGKGGGYLSPPLYARAANRGASAADSRHFSLGFRVARELP